MKKISGSTVYYKTLFPAFWFGFLAIFLTGSVIAGAPLLFFIAPIVMAVFGFFLFRRLVWDLADEVYDAGDYLVFRKGNQEQTVGLTDIINIDYSQMSSPERVTIHVRSEGPIGRELVFVPPMRLKWFGRAPIVSELIDRVDRARHP